MKEEKSISSSFVWRFLERWGAQGVSLIVSIVLARLLDPTVYGAIAVVTVLISFCDIFVDSGFSSALIQKKNADDLDFSSVFFFNLFICISLYMVLFFAAPFIADFYGIEVLRPVIRVQSLALVISGLKSVQVTYITKHMQFKKFFFATLGGTITAAVVGIWMAFSGYGIWALVTQGLVNLIIDTIILFLSVEWRPKLMFSFKRIKVLFSYGWKLLLSGIIYNSYADLRQLIIGKMYTTENLAYYNKGLKFPQMAFTNTSTALNSVLFPAMSKKQDDKAEIKALVKKCNKLSSYIVSPVMIGMAVIAKPLILLVLGEKWLFSVPFMQVFCIMYGLSAGIGSSNQNALKSIGKSDLLLFIEIVKCLVDIVILFISMNFGVFAIAVGMLVGTISRTFICAFPAKKYYGYSYIEQIKDVIPNLLLNAAMGIGAYFVSVLPLNLYLIMILQIISGFVIYVGLSIVFKNNSFYYVKDMLMNKLSRHK